MSATLTTLERRSFRLQSEDAPAAGTWYGEDPATTHLLNAYTILVPDGERFIIRTCSRYLDRVSPELKDELERLFFQEGSHSREHARLVRKMEADGLGMNLFNRLVRWLSYGFLESLTPLRLRLATAAAIEHHNATIATFFLNQALLKDIRRIELRRLFLWHFAEEIEHKETVFKLLESVSRSWTLRALGLFVSSVTFLTYLVVGAVLLSLKTGSAFTVGFWEQVLPSHKRRGLFASLGVESWRYLDPRFRPLVIEAQPLLSAALTELERLGIERTRPTGSTESRALPEAFRRKMKRTLDRFDKLRRTADFFFSPVEGYEGTRVRSRGARKLNFCTYSYLGLLHHERVDAAAMEALERHGTGTHGVRLLGGTLQIHEQLESKLANFLGREAAITFSSGFTTNVAVIGTLVGKGDYVLSDAHNHASIVDGCRSSRSETATFRHNDVGDLDRKLGSLPRAARKLIVVDAVFSMDGDVAPLAELLKIRDRHANTILMVDEAHSLGVLGRGGRGIEEHFDCEGQVDVLMGTLSKAIPCQGGYVVGSRELVTFLRYNARGFIFSAALSPVTAAAALAALEVLEDEGGERCGRLRTNTRYFTRRLVEAGFDIGNTQTAIVPILLGGESLAFEMARLSNEEGLYVLPVTYPAVPRGEARLRTSVTSEHCQEDLDRAVRTLSRARVAAREAVNEGMAKRTA